MTYTEDSYGMDGKVNLPNLTANVNWQSLENLYSVNESIYEYRPNYRLSLDDWANYLKVVDRVFALLNSHHEQNQTNKTDTAQQDGFLAVSAELSVPVEMAPSESAEDPMYSAGETPPLTLPADLPTLHLNQPIFSPESQLEWSNDIPEVSPLNSEHWRNHKTEAWVVQEEISHLETDFSGNGVSELMLQPSARLQPIGTHHSEDGSPSDDVYEGGLFLPVHSGIDSPFPRISVSTMKQPVNSSSEERISNEVEKDHDKEGFQSQEGSASFPLSSD